MAQRIITMKKETEIAVKAAEEAGKILMGHFGRKMKIRNKGSGIRDLVTQVDIESNRKIMSILKKAFPDYGILSEEIPEEKGKCDCRWIIDPLDGTHNFIYDLPLFGVSIALERKGKIVLGVINLPYYRQMYTAEKGRGSFLNGKGIRVSKRGIREAMVTFGTGKREPDRRKAVGIMKGLLAEVSDIRMLGSAVVHYAYLATGKLEVYIDMMNKPWDNAAGFLIVEEAGGKVTDFSGKPWDVNTIPFVVSNNRTHEEILRIINQ